MERKKLSKAWFHFPKTDDNCAHFNVIISSEGENTNIMLEKLKFQECHGLETLFMRVTDS